MRMLVGYELFDSLAAKLFPEMSLDALRQQLLEFEDADEFQHVVMYRCCQWVIENTMSQFTYSGTEYLDRRPCLYVSNHRDIVLDAMLLQYLLVDRGLDTSHIIIGSNLFEMPMMALLAKTNKMYSIGRGGTPREYYNILMAMSNHLRQLVTVRGESAWIAQRNGRTKDGRDRTDAALIKMIAYSGNREDLVGSLTEMHIIPVSVSYEWEPCGVLKAQELRLRTLGSYTKAPGEDSQSVVSGITDFKGRVHFTICPPIQPKELADRNGDFDAIAALIDQRICDGYHTWPNNYIAKAMLEGDDYAEYADEAPAFEKYIDNACRQHPMDETFRKILLGIYANPLTSTYQRINISTQHNIC